MEVGFKNKYLKYKRKYLDLKNSNHEGGGPDPCKKNHFCGDNGKQVSGKFQEVLNEIYGQTTQGDFTFKTPNGGEATFKKGLFNYKDDIETIFQILEAFQGVGLEFAEALKKANN